VKVSEAPVSRQQNKASPEQANKDSAEPEDLFGGVENKAGKFHYNVRLSPV